MVAASPTATAALTMPLDPATASIATTPSPPQLPPPPSPQPFSLLTQLPNELLSHVVRYLSGDDALALATSAKSIRERIETQACLPAQLADRIRWTLSMTGVRLAAENILRLPATQRDTWFDRLADQCRTLHPMLRERAEQALYRLRLPMSPAQVIRERIARWGDSHVTAANWSRRARTEPPSMRRTLCADRLPPLPEVLAAPYEVRESLLTDWLQAVRAAGQRPPGLAPWQRWTDPLTPYERVPLLAALAGAAKSLEESVLDGDAIAVLLDGMLDTARELAHSPSPSQALDRLAGAAATLLVERLVDAGEDAEEAPESWDTAWDRLYDLLPHLSPQSRAAVMSRLAFASGNRVLAVAGDSPPRWQRLLDVAACHLDEQAMVDLLRDMGNGTLVDGGVLRQDDGFEAMLWRVHEIADGMAPLPGAQVRAAILTLFPRDEAEFGLIWEINFALAMTLECRARAALLEGLAESASQRNDIAAEHARALLLDCIAALPPAWRLAPLLSLTRSAGMETRPMLGRAVLDASKDLPPADRARMVIGMLGVQQHDLVKLALLNAIMTLDPELRMEPAAVAIRALLTGACRASGWWQRAPHFQPPVSAIRIPQFRALPMNGNQAEEIASTLVASFPPGDHGRLLARISESPSNSVTDWSWLLNEVRKLAPAGRYDLLILTRLAYRLYRWASAVRTNGSEIQPLANELLDELHKQPRQQRASALRAVASALKALTGPLEPALEERLSECIAALPELDRPAVSSTGKRTADQAGLGTAGPTPALPPDVGGAPDKPSA